ncbi:hypothetical protein Cfor_03388 [Coptotermes formosanus]|uniref:Reverse transcriptase domain-containing protein n=1 Tax=Coptotermes formosanus TaxID=36987 RepID=A0A6L2Q8E3_COPFO|nr:hypothetical protein Cfor_03388 [Coptotermes formosanus]
MLGGIFCDLEKAFDCVSHEVLLNKLKFYGIIDIKNNLYRSYLQDRFQRTAIMNGLDNNKVSSEWAIISNGVPQGSVLGPLLFLVYINDLPMILQPNGVPLLFADDESVLISHANPIQFKNKINAVYRTLDNWFKKNLLSLNTVKTQYINFITKNNKLIQREIGDISEIITSAKQVEFLGLTITTTLTWETYTDSIKTNCAQPAI